MLIGRAAETAAIDRLLAGAREGRSGVLVIRGEAGVGKSALLSHALEQAGEMTVLRGLGVESESELAFAALHQILRPLLRDIERLPEPQAAALAAAFGLSSDPVDDRFRISLAVLGLLAEAAEARPIACFVDDAQWLDQASADALMFAARRFEADRIALLFAVRDDPARRFVAPGVADIRIDPLGTADARSLVDARLGVDTAPAVVEWLLASAAGNPLALLELPSALTEAQLAGREALGSALPAATSVEQSYLERVSRLPRSTQSLLLVAACEEAGDRATITHAAAALGLEADDLAAAETDGLVHVGRDRVEFHHPLVRSAIYKDAPFVERERAHRALAAVLTEDRDGDRRAWHLAAATIGTDDAVAAELERTADRARRRAGHAAASAALERAAELSADPVEAGRRLLVAAHGAGVAGRVRASIALADRAEPLVADPILRADLARVRGMAELQIGRPDLAADFLASGAEAAAPYDSGRALELASSALQAAALSGDNVRLARVIEHASSIEADPSDERQVALAAMLDGGGRVLRGDVAGGAARLEEGLLRAAASRDPGDIVLAAIAANHLGDERRARELYARAESQARAAGALSVLVFALVGQAAQSLLERRLGDAASQADEVARLTGDLGMENPGLRAQAVLAWIAAFQGREDDCRRDAERVLALSAVRGLALHAATATWALAELDLGRGRWEEALARLVELAEVRPGFGNNMIVIHSTADRTEAAVRAGRPDLASATLAGFETWVASTGARWALPLLARCRGLLEANADLAAEHFQEALRLHAEGGNSFDRARTELLYGELLRRERQRLDARRHLRSALATFEHLGAVHWAERAAVELRATGETARKRDPSTVAQLTPQELQIARLVGEGNSNKDVAAQLFLSPRTVEYHLRKIFAKLGIASRAELIRSSLADAGDRENALAALS